ncbi:Fe-S cluster assembly protein SufD|uniref:Iron-regulated ABC transporter permease protein SufD n=1 Tax=Brenneria salicis ATCC 15712 = DSM 30166 TaxID=714314 RepID=A0A366I5L2_9GAMM|nr:Fe-S cluster assembly protein SufD [Brenneria salicis]NMN91927.1 Fe-S cluster assembly protein SufD [Brenneria salicis ATCC 15712 = DSM 30166]RBP62852.1 iron-regulated ABC transporter permease protein SufD [Brenneria salicis ATCC 15712 = DSM 30166]RLM30723.1 FeS cluster assembly protein SufD [Brenneria salicis ATCC 15712 = DSM 30166]
MAGLPTNNKTSAKAGIEQKQQQALQQWHGLFDSVTSRSSDAYQHWQEVLRLGLPHRKHEHWKYTPLDGLLAHEFVASRLSSVAQDTLDALTLPIDAWRLVFIDGVFSEALSDTQWGPYQVEIKSARTPGEFPAAVQPEVFLHLTESLATQSTLIRLAANQQAEKSLYLLHISSSQGAALNTVHHRHHLQVERGASARIIEHYVSLEPHAHFTGARLTISADENSRVSHYKLAFEAAASYHFSHNDLVLSPDAQVRSHSFLLGAGLTRHNTSAQLNGEGTNLVINSLILPVGSEVCDTRTYLEHNQGHGESRQLHKTIVSDRAKAVFNGMIKVAPHALKTDGQMTNNNLLLGRLAEVDTKPQLEIYADDVKCSHGATIGRMDEEQLFYLRSRGITQQDAQQMIIFAFAAELTEAIEDESLRSVILERIAQRLPATSFASEKAAL